MITTTLGTDGVKGVIEVGLEGGKSSVKERLDGAYCFTGSKVSTRARDGRRDQASATKACW